MTIKEVCKKYDITLDTLRYYERICPQQIKISEIMADFTAMIGL